MNQPHKHSYVYLGNLQGELGGSYPIYHCSYCGTLMENFSRSVAILVPGLAKTQGVTVEDKFEFSKRKTSGRPQKRVLGRGLVELMARQPKLSYNPFDQKGK